MIPTPENDKTPEIIASVYICFLKFYFIFLFDKEAAEKLMEVICVSLVSKNRFASEMENQVNIITNAMKYRGCTTLAAALE